MDSESTYIMFDKLGKFAIIFIVGSLVVAGIICLISVVSSFVIH